MAKENFDSYLDILCVCLEKCMVGGIKNSVWGNIILWEAALAHRVVKDRFPFWLEVHLFGGLLFVVSRVKSASLTSPLSGPSQASL